MVSLPAICDNCGLIFNSGIAGSGGGTITITGSKAGPCPRCGGMGSIPDGTYRMIENIVEVLSAPERTLEELRKLSNYIDQANDGKMSVSELSEKTKEEIPSLGPFLDWIVPRNREEKFNFGMIILSTILPIIISALMNSKPAPQIKVETIINNIYHTEQVLEVPQKTPIKVNKVGRNEMCPCGSGLKYKKCHGQ